jgi:hypothetical protein
MRLRDYRPASAGSGRSGTGLDIRTRIAAAGTVVALLLIGGTTLAIKGRAASVPIDPATLCPTKRPPSEISVILLDVSDRFSEPQRLQIQNQLSRVRDSIPRFGLVEVYTVERLSRRVAEPVVHLCNPGTGADLNRIYQNPELAKKKWSDFAAELSSSVDRQISKPALKTSPIFESIHATALRTFGKPEYDGLPKRLVVVSDLLQNVPGGLSMYQGVPAFDSFEKTPYFSRVRADLKGIDVDLYYLLRTGSARQSKDHLTFWQDYFQSQGAEVEEVQKVFGDRPT